MLCRRDSEQLWALPKGTPEPGESHIDTAMREVREETGLEVEIGPRLGENRYSFMRAGQRYDKTVHFFLMSPTGGDLSDHDAEFDRVEWVPAIEAMRRLTFKNESGIVEAALSMAEERHTAQPTE